MMRAALAFAILMVCNGLGIQRQPSETMDEEGSELGQTGRSMSRISEEAVPWSNDVAKATQIALEARDAADAAAKQAEQQIGSNISERQLQAEDRRANAEANAEFSKQGKLKGLVDIMDRTAGHEDGIVGNLVWKTNREMSREDRQLASLARSLKRQQLQEDAAEDVEGQRDMRRSAKSFEDAERQANRDNSVAVRELKEVDKQFAAARAQKRNNIKMLEAAEAETSARLWVEANDLRAAADHGTLQEDEVLRVLDVTRETLDYLAVTLSSSSRQSEWGAWFEERVGALRSRSAAASAHLVETIGYRVKEFVEQHQDYDDRQFVPLLSRLLSSTRDEFGLLQKASAAISERIQGFERSNPENFTSALALAIDGVTRNVEFRNNLLQVDTNRLAHSSVAEACDQLSSMFATNMQPAYKTLGHMKEALDNITKVVPSIAGHKPSIRKMLKNRTLNLLNMAYMEHLAYKECATTLMTEVSPVIMERLHCSFSSSFVHASLNRAAAALAAFASWLAL